MRITVVDYNPAWPRHYTAEAVSLRKILNGAINKIHHIGSTAVPGLSAKPVIDIMITALNLELLDQKNAVMEEFGYEVMGEYGIAGRRFYRKGGDHRTHHIHAFLKGDSNVRRHLAFRDYLIAFPDVALEYENLKTRLALSSHDMTEYSDGKNPFIKYYEDKALNWGHTRPD